MQVDIDDRLVDVENRLQSNNQMKEFKTYAD